MARDEPSAPSSPRAGLSPSITLDSVGNRQRTPDEPTAMPPHCIHSRRETRRRRPPGSRAEFSTRRSDRQAGTRDAEPYCTSEHSALVRSIFRRDGNHAGNRLSSEVRTTVGTERPPGDRPAIATKTGDADAPAERAQPTATASLERMDHSARRGHIEVVLDRHPAQVGGGDNQCPDGVGSARVCGSPSQAPLSARCSVAHPTPSRRAISR